MKIDESLELSVHWLQADRLDLLQIIHNPGTPPDERLTRMADVIIMCEEPYQRYNGVTTQTHLAKFGFDRLRCGYQISGVPVDQVGSFVPAVISRCTYLFVTDLVDDFYESFGESWKGFILALQRSGDI